MRHLTIGVLAHVDAGKTSLTERLLHHAGVIDRVGRVDSGTTQTDTLAVERRRGITVRSAVVAFDLDDLRVNLVDTPGHPDFIAEVDRALRVLDGVVLVVSAVEGVQSQTRVLARALARLRVPVLVFANKVDRVGARDTGLLAELTARLGLRCVPMSTVDGLGDPGASVLPRPVRPDPVLAELLAEASDDFLTAYLDGTADFTAELARQTGAARVSPVYFGSAMTGAGVPDLVEGIRRFLAPAAVDGGAGPLRATVFKVERGRAGEKVAYAKVFSGTLAARDHVELHRDTPTGRVDTEGRVTAVRVFHSGQDTVPAAATAGRIARVWGLREVRVGDRLGRDDGPVPAAFPPPGLETAVTADTPRLFAALQGLAEQDPLVDVRQDDETGQITVRLYGEVQKEVISETLAEEHGIAVSFAGTSPVCVERPAGCGAALRHMGGGNPYVAALGLRIEPGPPGAGVVHRLEVELGALPLSFHTAIEEAVRHTLHRGLHGWEVVDALVTVTHTAYDSPVTVAADFRGLTRELTREALRAAGVDVLEPVDAVEVDLPADTLAPVLSRLLAAGGTVTDSTITDDRALVLGTIPSGGAHAFGSALPGLTRGEGLLSTEPAGHRPVTGSPPRRGVRGAASGPRIPG